MAEVQIKADLQSLAEAGAEAVIRALSEAITAHGAATWVLAGGTAPMGAYAILAERYQDKLDWSKVQVLIGDERCVPVGHADANWGQIRNVFLDKVPFSESNKLRPKHELSAEDAAADYQRVLEGLAKNGQGIPRFDHVWLGMGEDGHTLSLFPGHPALKLTEPLVIPVHDSPKPPPDRISLTLRALTNVNSCVIMAAGAGKADIISRVMSGDTSLPIVQAVQTIEANGGHVTWLLDTAAVSKSGSRVRA
jgi:6-phosphogluconolactonase